MSMRAVSMLPISAAMSQTLLLLLLMAEMAVDLISLPGRPASTPDVQNSAVRYPIVDHFSGFSCAL
jgi:hypothetical protein